MRTYEFRGRSMETQKWVYGDLRQLVGGATCIVTRRMGYARSHDVYPGTVGQYIAQDVNDVRIFEGDRVGFMVLQSDVLSDYTQGQGVIKWNPESCDYELYSEESGEFLAAFGMSNTAYAVLDEREV